MEKEERTIWHYAVHMAPTIFMEPACMIVRDDNPPGLRTHGMTKVRGDVNCRSCKDAMGMPDDFNYVGKYDALMVYEQPGTGNRWSVVLGEWGDPETGQFTSWIDEEERPELELWLKKHEQELPEGGHWVNINEA